jgi:long-chain acyl-CoA synthetase
MNYPPLTQLLLQALDKTPNPRAMLYRAESGWQAISSAEVLRRVAGLSAALAGLGVKSGDRVGLFAPNCPEWHIADLAAQGLGAITVPVYFNDSPERLCYIVNHSGARVVFVAGAEQARRLLSCRARLPAVEQVIVAGAPPDLEGEFLRYETLIARAGAAEIERYRQGVAQLSSDQILTIIYTSGTTGEPKGVVLTHANLSSNVLTSPHSPHFRKDDIGLSFLPLAHVYERMVDYTYLARAIPVAYVEHPLQVQAALVEVRPTVVAAVPRFFEKIYANIMEKAQQVRGRKRQIFGWAMEVARAAAPWRAYGKPVPLAAKLRWHLANQLVYAKICAGLGGRVRSFISGGAPLARELAEFFWSVGIPIYQGYGLTETSPVISTNAPGQNKVGTVGRPIAGVEVRIAEDGEILVRGPCVMQGYYLKPEETREALDADGWLRTGDIGHLDEDGYLLVTDRKKDLIKTAGGKFVAPQPIENRLKTSPLILNSAVIGDRRRFVVALIVPHFANVEARAREIGLTFSSPAELAAHPQVREWIGEEIERLTSHLAQYERIKRFALLDHDFTFEGGQLTYTMKLKRRVIEQRYAEIIESLYAEASEVASS